MAKGIGTQKYTFKFLGFKIGEFELNWHWNETSEETEEIRDDIILHERILSIKNQNNTQ